MRDATDTDPQGIAAAQARRTAYSRLRADFLDPGDSILRGTWRTVHALEIDGATVTIDTTDGERFELAADTMVVAIPGSAEIRDGEAI